MNDVSLYSLEELERAVSCLELELSEKIGAVKQAPMAAASRAGDFDHVYFMRGEVLMFGGITKYDVINVLTRTGLLPNQYQMTMEGGPLYFCDSERYPDTEKALSFYLSQSDLPYGFVGTSQAPGTFQFSSPQIARLNLASAVQEVDDAFMFYGSNANGVTYDKIVNATDYRYMWRMYSFGLIPGANKQDLVSAVNAGNFARVFLETKEGGVDVVYQANLADTQKIVAGTSKPTIVKTSLEMGNYFTLGTFIGWRFIIKYYNPARDELKANLLEMPPGQMTEFDVNPGPQEEYHGAEGVYPVILVEMLQDVNVYF